MAILTVNNIQQSFGEEVILQEVTFELQKGERVGLVGVNGSGKTTLFKVLTGEYSPDTGSVTFGKDTVLGYMEQHVCRDFHKTAFDEVMTVFAPLLRLERELEDVTALLAEHPSGEDMERLIQRQTDLNERFVDAGGLTCRSRARSALLGLGFEESQLQNKVGVLSGGQKAKLQLAKMLLSGANLLLLDEPTNHLDIQAVEWLESFLLGYSGSYIVISHDRYFLDKVTNRTLEMEGKTVTSYKGNYSRYLDLRAEHRLAMERVYESKQKEIARLEGIIEQQRRWNQERNYVTIASKQKAIDRIEATLEKPEEEPDTIRFQFKASRRGGNDVLTAQDLSLSFHPGQPLFEHVGIEIKHGEKVFLIGPNGCGKTSLFKILLGQYTPDTGLVRLGAAIDVGYYEQSQLSLHDEKTVIDERVQACGGAVRRGAGPGAAAEADAFQGQLPAAGRAHQPPGHRLLRGAGGRPLRLRWHFVCGEPRPGPHQQAGRQNLRAGQGRRPALPGQLRRLPGAARPGAAGPAGRNPRAQGEPLQAAQGAGKRPAQKAHRPAAAGGGHRGERGPGGAAGGTAFPAGSGRGL